MENAGVHVRHGHHEEVYGYLGDKRSCAAGTIDGAAGDNTVGKYCVGAVFVCTVGELDAVTGGETVWWGKGAGKWLLCAPRAGR